MKQTMLSAELETAARDLYEKACCGSKLVWPELSAQGGMKNASPELREKFISHANRGMRDAQSFIVDRVLSSSGLSVSEEILFRGVADSIAWQLLGNQLCHARRLYKEQLPPNLKQSNFDSVVHAAKNIVKEHPDSMPLLSDLTSFIQVGDIFASIPGRGMTLIEVKEGKENMRLFDLMHFQTEDEGERAFQSFMEQNDPKMVKQLERMLRQAGRMAHYAEIVNTGISEDPDTGQEVKIPENAVQIDSWDDELHELLDNPEAKGWGIHVVDQCLFIGCYFDQKMAAAGHAAFNTWFDSCGGTQGCPRARLFDSMKIPLALPVFNLKIPHERMFDLLFGRLQVCMGVNVDALLLECENAGIQVRFGRNRETSQLEQIYGKVYRHKGRSINFGNGEVEMAVADGLFIRMLFHGQKPISLIKEMLSNMSESS
jgi:hypothetical protein